jgi:CRP/FNR family cyclic AMP-dependent transcriptional regulator
MENLEHILTEHPFFRNLDPRYLQLITGCASNVRFSAGQFIFREGEEANQFYLIRQGNVALEVFSPQGGPITVQTLSDGDILGWSWLFPPYRWKFDARAVNLTRAIALDGACLRKKSEEDHELALELLKRFSLIVEERLQATRLQLLNVYEVRP